MSPGLVRALVYRLPLRPLDWSERPVGGDRGRLMGFGVLAVTTPARDSVLEVLVGPSGGSRSLSAPEAGCSGKARGKIVRARI